MSSNVVRLIHESTTAEVFTTNEDDAVRVKLEPDGVTLIGCRSDVHRVVIEVDRALSRAARPGLSGF